LLLLIALVGGLFYINNLHGQSALWA
jgi:hypothetical protein